MQGRNVQIVQSVQKLLTSWPRDLLTSRPPDLKTSWPQDLLTSWPPDLETSWPQDILISRPPDLKTFWPQDLLTLRPSDLKTSWPQDLLTSRLPDLKTSWPQDLLNSRSPDLKTSWPGPHTGSNGDLCRPMATFETYDYEDIWDLWRHLDRIYRSFWPCYYIFEKRATYFMKMSLFTMNFTWFAD